MPKCPAHECVSRCVYHDHDCFLMDCDSIHAPAYHAVCAERDRLLCELETTGQMINELQEALRRAVNQEIAKDDERSLECLQQLHDAKAVIRLLVKVL